MAAEAPKVSFKLFIDKKAGKVLNAEADKHFVDFLFYIVSLPVASVIKHVDTNSQLVGSLGKVYNSIANIGHTYLLPDTEKDTILNPKLRILPSDKMPLLLPGGLFTEMKFYTCYYNKSLTHKASYVSDQLSLLCPECTCPLSTELSYVAPKKEASSGSGGDGGFVKADMTYMVMDDLEVKLLSTSSCISVLNKFNIKDVGSIEEKDVQLGVDEGSKVLSTY